MTGFKNLKVVYGKLLRYWGNWKTVLVLLKSHQIQQFANFIILSMPRTHVCDLSRSVLVKIFHKDDSRCLTKVQENTLKDLQRIFKESLKKLWRSAYATYDTQSNDLWSNDSWFMHKLFSCNVLNRLAQREIA